MKDDIVERLKTVTSPENYEAIMKGWDAIRGHLLNGVLGSLPRDMFESIIGDLLENITEASQALAAREREVEGLISAVGEHVTVRSEYLARAQTAEASLLARDERVKELAGDVIALAEHCGELANLSDGPCAAEGLCGEYACEQIGCIKDKADRARARLLTVGEGEEELSSSGVSVPRPQMDAPTPSSAEVECHGLDTPERVCFYEQDFYPLSNFSAFTMRWHTSPREGWVRFDTSEAVYHWEKFACRGSIPTGEQLQIARLIHEAPSAHEAFKIAERNKHLRRQDWDDVKVGIMRDILRAKAAQHEYIHRKLLATGDRELVENSWRDDFWGWGPNRDGQNMLGKLWMEVRSELRSADPPSPAPDAVRSAEGEE